MSVSFYVAPATESDSWFMETGPLANFSNSNAISVLTHLRLPDSVPVLEWGEVDPEEILIRLDDALSRATDDGMIRRLRSVGAVAEAARQKRRQVAWG